MVAGFRTVFLGTPITAVPSLSALHQMSDVALVVTRPNRPRGRSGIPLPPPVKEAAAELGLTVSQPASREELEAKLREVGPVDVGVVTAFGMIIPKAVLALPRRGMVNIHFSLLPRWRGASPVQAALMAGDHETGVSLMQMDEGLDTGPVLATATTTIRPSDDGAGLSSRLAAMGATLLSSHLQQIVAGEIKGHPQAPGGSSYAPRLTAADRRLALHLSPDQAVNKIRALAPRPGAVLEIDGQLMRILAARASPRPLPAGQIEVSGEELLVGMSEGSLEILVVQPPGGREMGAAEWLRGLRRHPAQAR